MKPNPSGHKTDYSMWDIIDAQPPPVITREQARIGAAQVPRGGRKTENLAMNPA